MHDPFQQLKKELQATRRFNLVLMIYILLMSLGMLIYTTTS
jgi:hypothetical protein